MLQGNANTNEHRKKASEAGKVKAEILAGTAEGSYSLKGKQTWLLDDWTIRFFMQQEMLNRRNFLHR